MTPPAQPPPTPTGDRYLRLINQINTVILGGGDLDDLLDRVVDVIRDVLEVERVSIFLIDPTSQWLRIRAARGIPRTVWPEIAVPLGEGILGRVAQDGLPLLSSDIRETGLPTKGRSGYRDHSFASVPLMIHDRILGVLNINNRFDGEPLDEADLQLILAVAALVSLAVENATLLTNALTIQKHFREAFSQLRQGVIGTDANATVQLFNTVASHLLGIEPDQAIGRVLYTVLPPELISALKPLIRKSMNGVTSAEQEVELITSSGDSRPLRVTLTTLRDTTGEVSALVIVLEDLSLSREVQELRRLDELKSNFLSMVSHELRTPLTSIKGTIHLLSSGALEESTEQRKPMYEILRKNTERLILQINNILDVNQLEHQTLRIFPRAVELNEIIRRACDRVAREYKDKCVTLNLDLEDKTPLLADPERLGQVIEHLVDNALKFTSRDGCVDVSARRGDGKVEILIRDTGIGLAAEFRDKVFAKFFQLEHTLTRQAGGNGLGLFLAKGLVDLHGGTIEFLPVQGPGAAVKVTLPLRPPGADDVSDLTEERFDV